MISLLAAKAPTGIPAPITLPNVIISALVSKIPLAPVKEALNPVITSSKINNAPFASHNSLQTFKNSGEAGTNPIFPAIGSIIIQEISFESSKHFFKFSMLLYSHNKVCLVKSAGTPGELGAPNVAIPEPA